MGLKIGITLTGKAFTPEAFAYERYLSLRGHSVQLEKTLDPNNDLNIYFMGTRFSKTKGSRAIEVHEYQSLSTGRLNRLKDWIKVNFSTLPSGRIFLNKYVAEKLNFHDNKPYILRDMGVENELFQVRNKHSDYDILYCGSYREGLDKILYSLSRRFTVLFVGSIPENIRTNITNSNITFLGRVNRSQLPEIYRTCKYGLNYVPDIEPFNRQTSTKLIEYMASGLGIISNDYHWVNSFFRTKSTTPIWIHEILQSRDFTLPDPIKENVDEYRWENILQSCHFESFLVGLLQNQSL